MRKPIKMREPTFKYNIKITWGMRRALNRAVARKTLALNSTGVLLLTLPSMNHVMCEVIASRLNLEMPRLEIDAQPADKVNLMFESPWRVKKAFVEHCNSRNLSQNNVINELLKEPLEDIEERVKIDSSLGWEPGQGFTCSIDSSSKRKLFQRCAVKMLDCDGRRQWGIGDMLIMTMAAATGEPLPEHFFAIPDANDDDVFSMIITMPLTMHKTLQDLSDDEGKTMSKFIRKWLVEYVDQYKV